MKRYTYRTIIIMMVAVILLTGCQKDLDTCTLSLTLSAQEHSKTISPSGVNLTPSKYVIRGTGPYNASFLLTSARDTVTIEGLVYGNWKIEATSLTDDDVEIAQGEADIAITSAQNKGTVVLNRLVGKGSMEIRYHWNAAVIDNPGIDIELVKADGTSQKISPAVDNTPGGSVTIEGEYPAGYYTLKANLYSGSVHMAGCTEVVRIVSKRCTASDIQLSLDKETVDDKNLDIVDKEGRVIECVITGVPSQSRFGTPMTAVLKVDDTTFDIDSLDIVWYLDGVKIGEGKSITFNASVREHSLDVTARLRGTENSGSGKFTFTVLPDAKKDVPYAIQKYLASDSRFLLGGGTNIRFLDGGKLLIHTEGTDRMHICRIINNKIDILKTYEHGNSSLQLKDVKDIIYTPVNSRLFFMYRDSSAINGYDFNIDTNDISLCVKRTGTTVKDDSNPLSNFVYNSYSKRLYCKLRESGKILILNPLASNDADFTVGTMKTQRNFKENHEGVWKMVYGESKAYTSKDGLSTIFMNWYEDGTPADIVSHVITPEMMNSGPGAIIDLGVMKTIPQVENGQYARIGNYMELVFADSRTIFIIMDTRIICYEFDTFSSQWVFDNSRTVRLSEKGIGKASDCEVFGDVAYILDKEKAVVQAWRISSSSAPVFLGDMKITGFVPENIAISQQGTYMIVSGTDQMMLCKIDR